MGPKRVLVVRVVDHPAHRMCFALLGRRQAPVGAVEVIYVRLGFWASQLAQHTNKSGPRMPCGRAVAIHPRTGTPPTIL